MCFVSPEKISWTGRDGGVGGGGGGGSKSGSGGEAGSHSGADKGEGDTGRGSLRVWKKGFGSFWLNVLEPL